MNKGKQVVRIIDCISEWTGRTIRWFCLILVLILAFETISRYVFNKSQIWVYEVVTMIGLTIAVLGWSYVYKHNAHIRVDILYERLSLRGKAIIDVVGALIFFFPFLIIFVYSSGSWMSMSWKVHERLIQSGWVIPAGPIRSVMFIGLFLFLLQGVAIFIKDLYYVISRKTL